MGPEAYRRRASVRWTSSADDGDAAEAVAEIETWLTAQAPAPLDWEGTLGALRDMLLRLSVEPLLMNDPVARDLMRGLATPDDAEALGTALEALRRRAEEIAEARERVALDGPRTLSDILTSESRGKPARSILRM